MILKFEKTILEKSNDTKLLQFSNAKNIEVIEETSIFPKSTFCNPVHPWNICTIELTWEASHNDKSTSLILFRYWNIFSQEVN